MTRRRCRWKPFYRRLADTRRRFLFGSFGGVCNTPLPYRPIEATSIHSPSSGTILWANNPKVLPLETILGANDPKAPPLENILGAPSSHTLPFLVPNIWGRMQYAPTLPADRGDLHSFAAIGKHFGGALRPRAAVSCSNRLGAYAIRPYPDGRQRQLPFIRRH